MQPESAKGACDAIRKQLEIGAPWEACDAFQAALAKYPADANLLYWGALANARAGASRQAGTLLDQAQQIATGTSPILDEILSLRGRLWKDEILRTHDRAARNEFARRSRDEYLAAYSLRRENTFPGINAASLSLLLGEVDIARALANEILAKLAAKPEPLSFWEHATAGEAHLLLGSTSLARECYAAAYSRAPDDAGNVATLRKQVMLLSEALPEASGLLDLLKPASVLAFTGHLIDGPGRVKARFPAEIEPAASDALRKHLAQLHQPKIYCSAACGADLILIEAALDLGAEVNVVLPFDREDFIQVSVAVGGETWVRRFERALTRVARVIMATDENFLGDLALFEHAAALIEGLTVLRAAQLQTSPDLLCLIDPSSAGETSGALAMFERWQRDRGVPQVIDLRSLRDESSPREREPAKLTVSDQAVSRAADGDTLHPRPERTLKSLLFADFSGFGSLHDAFAPVFHARFLRHVAAQLAACETKPLEANTWGDALYVVFESPHHTAEFALSLLAQMLGEDWSAAGLPDSSQIRIALHAGPVFCGFDPIIGRDNYFGSSVTRTARLEPITPPGTVYTSEVFAASLSLQSKGATMHWSMSANSSCPRAMGRCACIAWGDDFDRKAGIRI